MYPEEAIRKKVNKQISLIENSKSDPTLLLRTLQLSKKKLKFFSKVIYYDYRKAIGSKTQILNGVAKNGKNPTSVKSKLTSRKQTRS